MSTWLSMSVSRSIGQRASTCGGLSTGYVSTARIRVLKLLTISAIRRPTPPSPTIPTVLWCKSRVGRRMNCFTCWARKNTGKLRVNPHTSAIACSAT